MIHKHHVLTAFPVYKVFDRNSRASKHLTGEDEALGNEAPLINP